MAHPHESLDRAARIITPEIALGLLDALNVGLLLVDRSGSVIHRNQAAAALLPAGQSLEELFSLPAEIKNSSAGGVYGKSRPSAASAPQSREVTSWSAMLSNVIESDRFDATTCVADSSGPAGSTTYRVRMMPLVHADGGDATRVVVLVDRSPVTSEIPRLEAGAAPSHKRSNTDLTSKDSGYGPAGAWPSPTAVPGETAARVAHELNNPIDAILRYINLAIRLSENVSEPKLHDYLAQSRSGLMRMVEIISDMLIGPLAPCDGAEPLDIRTVIDDAVRTYMPAADSAHVEVSLEVADGKIHPRYGTRLFQICTNLIRNALDAMPGGGRLTITAIREHDQEMPEDHGRDWYVIRVADAGVGLPADVNGVFASFYTTKQPAHGAGLGLSICREYAEAMGGIIEAKHGEKGGAVFIVKLPGSLFAADDVSVLSPGSLLRAWAANGR